MSLTPLQIKKNTGYYCHFPELTLELQDQPLLRLPFELNRKNCRAARWHVEKERDNALQMLKNAASAAVSTGKTSSAAAAASLSSIQGNTDSSLTGNNENDEITTDNDSSAISTNNAATACLDTLIQRMHGLKRKLESLHEEEKVLHMASRRRIEHLQSLYEIQSLADVKYEMWSKVRLSRLLVDYLLRGGYDESAKALAKAKGIEEMVDVDAFVQCHRVENSLKRGKTQEGLAWCNENKQVLRKMNVCDLTRGDFALIAYANMICERAFWSLSYGCNNTSN